MQYKFGIDFGTTNSSIAYRRVDQKNNEQTIVVNVRDRGNRSIMPSLFWFDENGNMAVGDEARNRSATGRLVRQVKLDLEAHGGQYTYTVGKKTIGIVTVITEILRGLYVKAKDDARYTNTDVYGVVMGVPVAFGDNEKEVLLEALTGAGFYQRIEDARQETEFVSEPVAVAVHYGLDIREDCNVLVFDYGGGTLDLTLMNLKTNIGTDKLHPHRVLAKGRPSLRGEQLGGEILNRRFFTEVICPDYGLETLNKAFRIQAAIAEELWEKLKRSNHAAFIDAVEKCKCDLSDHELAYIDYVSGKVNLGPKREFRRRDFEKAIEPCLKVIAGALDELLADAGDEIADWKDVDHVIVAGGSSLIPVIQEILEDRFPKRVTSREWDREAHFLRSNRANVTEKDVMTSIVRGLAAVGGSGKKQARVNDLVDHDYGIKDDVTGAFLEVIPHGTPYLECRVDRVRKEGKFYRVSASDPNASRVGITIQERSPALAGRVRELQRVIINRPGSGFYRVFFRMDEGKGMLEVMVYDERRRIFIEDGLSGNRIEIKRSK